MSVILGNIPADKGTTEVSKPNFFKSGPIPITQVRMSTSPTTTGSAVTSAITASPAVPSADPIRCFASIFYFRIWLLPLILDAQNPVIDSAIPFRIWNAFLRSNELQAVGAIDADGVTLDIVPGVVLKALEFKEANLFVGASAPFQIDAEFLFDFEFGEATLQFLALLADIIPLIPDVPIQETYEWLTDEIRSYNGREQRIGVRQRPRRTLSMDITLLSDDERRKVYDKLYKTIARTVIAPSYQFQAPLKQATVVSDNKIYCNTKRADLREGENVVIVAPDNTFFVYTVDELFPDYATLTRALTSVIPKGSIVTAGFKARLPNNTAISMMSIEGKTSLRFEIISARDQIAQPGSVVTLSTFDGYPVLNRFPLADSEAQEAFDLGIEVIDNEIAEPSVYTNWAQPYVSGTRRFLIQSLLDINDSEWWRLFLDHCKGKQRAFLMSTNREDIKLVEGSNVLVSQLEVQGNEFATSYFDSETYKRIEIETNQGTFWTKVTSVENFGTYSILEISPALPVDTATVEIFRISNLMLARLGGDTVTFTHNGTHSIIEFPIRTAIE